MASSSTFAIECLRERLAEDRNKLKMVERQKELILGIRASGKYFAQIMNGESVRMQSEHVIGPKTMVEFANCPLYCHLIAFQKDWTLLKQFRSEPSIEDLDKEIEKFSQSVEAIVAAIQKLTPETPSVSQEEVIPPTPIKSEKKRQRSTKKSE